MSQRVHNLSKWMFIGEGRSLSFGKPKRRTVVLDVNSPEEVAYYLLMLNEDPRPNPEKVSDEAAGRVRRAFASSEGPAPDRDASDNGPLLFLGVAKGRERFEFAVDGGFSLIPEGGAAYVYSADGLQVETHVVSPVVFTRIANRRARNPQLELIEYRRRMNEEARLQKLEAEAERRVRALEAQLERYLPERNVGTLLRRPPVPEGREASPAAVGGDDAGERPERDVPQSAVATAKPKRKAPADETNF